MWFNNLSIYRLTKPFDWDDNQLEQQLIEKSFQPCSGQETQSIGWCSPLGKHSEQLVHSNNGYLMICAKEQEKLLPAAVINEQLEEKVQAIEAQESRQIYRKEKAAIKDELIFDLLPRAFSRSRLVHAYIAPHKGYIVVNTSSASKAESVLNLLRESLGSLAVIPLSCKSVVAQSLTHWVQSNQLPEHFTLGQDCVLKDTQTDAAIRCKQVDLQAQEITAHLDAGLYISQLQLFWQDKLSCTIDEKLSIKQLKFLEILQEQANDQGGDDAASQFDADFAIMNGVLDDFINDVIRAFGGEVAA